MSIEVRNISRTFGSFAALKDVSLEVPSGELVALLGPSGSGKSTLLRIIAGLESADAGQILFDGQDISRRPLRDRRVGFVFQHYALFRHLSVFDNIAFGLRIRPRSARPDKAEIRHRVQELLKLVKLEGLHERYPAQLSGGQRQRVGLARALAVEPRVLLLDEPFGALDARVRKELRRWLRHLHEQIHTTSIFVTHDQEEALELGHRVVVMNEGRVEQVGTPEAVYEKPASAFVCSFLGEINRFHGRIRDGRLRFGSPRAAERAAADHAAAEHDGVGVGAGERVGAGAGEGAAVGYVRPHELLVSREPPATPAFEAQIRHIAAIGPLVRLELKGPDPGPPIEAHLSKEQFLSLQLRRGERVFLSPSQVRVFPDDYSI